GLPTPALGRYKVAWHHGGPPLDPEGAWTADPTAAAHAVELVGSWLPGCDPANAIVETCPYDNTPDEDFVLDRTGNVVIGAGTSGHGFKFGPLLGDVLADLATGVTPPVDVARFAARR
ncbi:MAG TPA: FAD-dependent oxidoreductase, partial [Acidimicrobiales bacterium]|nr:FAD-dependent oxidoreductase [Acidimicrobiales bacterium]